MNPQPPSAALVESAQLVALANRQRLLRREAEQRVIAKAVAEALKG